MKTRKILSIALALVMLFGTLAVGASATSSVSNIGVYISGVNTIGATPYELSTVTDTNNDGKVTALEAAKAAYSSFDYYDSTGGAWLYTVNGKQATYSAKDYELSSGDFLAFYFVPDYTTDSIIVPSYFTAYVDSNGRVNTYGTATDLINDYGMEIGLNYEHPTVRHIPITTSYAAGTNTSIADGYLYISNADNTITGRTVLTTCHPVKTNCSDWINNMHDIKLPLIFSTTGGITENEIGTTAYTQLNSYKNAIGAQQSQPARMLGAMCTWEDYFAGLSYNVDARLDYAAFTGDIAVTEPFYPYFTSYTVQSTTADPTAVPNNFTMTITPKDSTAAVTVTGSTGVSVSGTGNTRLVTLPDDTTSTITVAITKSTVTKTYTFTLTTPPAPTNSASVYAFLPAPGQFTNEGMGTGGWGDIYNAAGDLKMNESTGVSLGYFGGYVVYQFDSPVSDSTENPYGADFIVYGNALWNNSEPGAIQVAQGVPVVENGVTTGYVPGDANNDGVVWYDIAGYKYYTSDTVKNYKLVYGNPNQESDPASSKANVPYDVYINNVKQATGGTVSVNSFHNHLWFPLYANYFANRTINSKSCPAIPKYASFDFADYDTTAATINGISCYRTMTLSGTKLSNVVTNNTAIYGFGYADVHPNVELGGTTAYNPYLTFSSSNDYATKTAGTSGGDPIDIAWAVYPDGTMIDNVNVSNMPAGLESIQFVRVYTAAAQGNGVFGEVSTEVCGIAAVVTDNQTSVDVTEDPTVYIKGEDLDSLVEQSLIGYAEINGYSVYYTNGRFQANDVVTVSADAGANIYVNDSRDTLTIASGLQFIRIITQLGDAAPSIMIVVL